jgi:hypothetical protein
MKSLPILESGNEGDALLAKYLKRNRWLQSFAWISVAIPLALFVLFSVLTAREASRYTELQDQIQTQEKTIAAQQSKIASQAADIEKQQQQIVVSQTAISLVKEQSPGQRPRINIYRKSIAGQVVPALRELGYVVELMSSQANPTLQDVPVDTISYGCGVRNEDIRTIAVALTQAGNPVRRIEPATRKPDPDLVQVVASLQTRESGLSPLTVDQIKSWSRPNPVCGASQQ